MKRMHWLLGLGGIGLLLLIRSGTAEGAEEVPDAGGKPPLRVGDEPRTVWRRSGSPCCRNRTQDVRRANASAGWDNLQSYTGSRT